MDIQKPSHVDPRSNNWSYIIIGGLIVIAAMLALLFFSGCAPRTSSLKPPPCQYITEEHGVNNLCLQSDSLFDKQHDIMAITLSHLAAQYPYASSIAAISIATRRPSIYCEKEMCLHSVPYTINLCHRKPIPKE